MVYAEQVSSVSLRTHSPTFPKVVFQRQALECCVQDDALVWAEQAEHEGVTAEFQTQFVDELLAMQSSEVSAGGYTQSSVVFRTHDTL